MTFLGIGIGAKRTAGSGGLGPELLVNGDFGAGATGWTVTGADGTHIATFSGGTLRYQSGATSPQLLIQNTGAPAIVANRQYRVVVVCSAWTSGAVKCDGLLVGGSPVVLASASGTFTHICTSVGVAQLFAFSRVAANVDLTLDSISVRQVIP